MAWRITKRAFAILVLAVVAGVSGLAIATRLTGGKLLSVQSGSMVPAIHKGDLVIVNRVPDSTLKVGDVITFTDPIKPTVTITHRIIELPTAANGRRFTTKGDANKVADQPIPKRLVLGKMEHRLPQVGYAVDFIRHPLGLALIIYVPALTVVIAEIRRLAAYYKSQQPYMVPWRADQRGAIKIRGSGLKLFGVLIVAALAIAVPARAALHSQASLTGNTISTKSSSNGGGSTTVTNNTNINVSNNVSQTATCGDVIVDGQTNAGSPHSCDASNSSSTNIQVQVSH